MASQSLDKSYDPHRIESRWYQFWEREGFFAPSHPDAPPYCIMIPPPNVTGSLHMGHAFQDLIMDALIRYHRMQGRHTLWQPGTDHAGIATQMLVERMINAEGKTRHDYGRERFIEKVWQWKAESGGMISQQLRRMGASPDWDNERFTMDPGLSEAVKRVFVDLYDEGIIYRGKRLVNWDPVLHTALSDLEVLSEEEAGDLWYIRYPLADGARAGGKNYLTVATTRPETMLGDSAVAVHPDDERYRGVVGGQVELPLTGRRIPIIRDEYVDPEFGSGCVKITPAHDFNDYQVWSRHRHTKAMRAQPHAGLINIFTDDAAIRDNFNDLSDDGLREGELLPAAYLGLERFQARKRIVADLEAQKLIDKTVDHKLKIPRGDRSGAVVEPYLTDQWYVDLTRETLADGRPGGKARITDPSIAMVRDGRVRFVPGNWRKTYYQWLENIEDWCISRQIWWGHRIPAWYDDDGNIYVGADEAAVREKYALPAELALRQDEDVLDTWFSSALWPFSTLGWPQKTARLETFYPTSVLVTGFDIIFFWVARMIMMGARFMDKPPFHQVYIHGLVRDAHGNKMSKSKGNVLDPIDLIDGIDLESLVKKRTGGLMRPQDAEKIEKQTRQDFPDGIPRFGADALRFTFASLASTGRDINFDLGRTEGYRNFCNKIWNAARFVLMNAEGEDCGGEDEVALSLADKWIISTLQRSQQAVGQAIDKYRFDLAAREIYELIWSRYCDWYLELCKPVLNNPNSNAAQLRGTRRTLAGVMEAMLRLAHPIMPFITEEIWQQIAPLAGKRGTTIMTQPYPQPEPERIDQSAERQMEWVMDIVLGIRKMRGENHIPPGKRIPVVLAGISPTQRKTLATTAIYIETLAKTEPIQMAKIDHPNQPQVDGVMAMIGETQIILPVSPENIADEIARTNKELQALEGVIAKSTSKLANPNFVKKAPKSVVEKEQSRLDDLQAKRVKLEQQLTHMNSR